MIRDTEGEKDFGGLPMACGIAGKAGLRESLAGSAGKAGLHETLAVWQSSWFSDYLIS